MHRDYDFLSFNTNSFPIQNELTKNDYVIVAGDFGYVWYGGENVAETNPGYEIPPGHKSEIGTDDYLMEWFDESNFTTLFVDGNHENHALLDTFPVEEWHGGKIHRIKPSVIHLMRGQVFEIDGKNIFTMGGASSTDKEYRKENVSWWERELPSPEEYEEARHNLERHNNCVDYIITHCISTRVMYDMGRIRAVDTLTDFLTEIDMTVDYKHWYFGHFHDDVEIDDKHTMLYLRVLELKG